MQIGPRIRVGGTLGKIGQAVKIGVGKVASNPIAEGLAGAFLGPEAAAGLGAIGRTLDTSHGSVGLGDIAKGGLQGFGAGTAGGLVKGALSGAAGAAGGGSVLDRLKGLASGTGSDGKGNFGVAGDLAGQLFGDGSGDGGGGGSGGGIMDKLLMGGAIASAANDRAKQSGLIDQATGSATDAYNAKAPLRSRALAGLSGQSTAPDLSSIFANPGNVYDQQARGTLSPRVPAAAAQMTQGPALSNALSTRAQGIATPPGQSPAPAPMAALPAAPGPMKQFAQSY